MTQEAMKLALEALKKCHYYMIDAGLPNQSLLNEAFTAYKALEALKGHAISEVQRLGQEIEQEPVADALHFAHWTTDKKDLSDYILVGSLTLAGIEDGEYGASEIDPLDNTIDALQERLVTGSDHKKVPLLAYIGALKPTPPQRTEPLIGCVNHDCDKCKAQTQEPVKIAPVKIAHRHEWFRTGEMKVGQMRCISCGAWGQEEITQRTWVGLDHQDKKKFSSWLDHKTDDEVFTAIDDLLRKMNT